MGDISAFENRKICWSMPNGASVTKISTLFGVSRATDSKVM
jgi:hypothetical protein